MYNINTTSDYKNYTLNIQFEEAKNKLLYECIFTRFALYRERSILSGVYVADSLHTLSTIVSLSDLLIRFCRCQIYNMAPSTAVTLTY